MSLRHLSLSAAIITAMVSTTALATPSGSEFVKKVSIANQFEIQTSQLALDKSHNDGIEKFAQKMVDDHTETAGKLVDALEQSTVKTQPQDDVDASHAKMIAKLDKASGESFDRQYIALQTVAHHEAVALFTDYAAHGKDPALKQFAADTLPALKMHLKHVQKLSAK